jgi:hypothetical protein
MCDAKVNVPDEKWGPFINRCQLQPGHGGPHMVALNACEPQAWMGWIGSYEPPPEGDPVVGRRGGRDV